MDNGRSAFNELIATGTSAANQTGHTITDDQQGDERGSPHEQEATAHYIAGLGYAGLGNKAKAHEEFNSALNLTPDFLSAKIALVQLESTN